MAKRVRRTKMPMVRGDRPLLWDRGAAGGTGGGVGRGAIFGPLSHTTAIALILLFGIPLLLVFLGTGDSVDMMELFNLVPVREAFRDHHWLMPTLGGVPRLEKPPLTVWLPAGLAAMLHSDSLWVLRMPSALLGLVTAISTYWIGCITSPGEKNRKFALIAAFITLTMVVFLRNARLASYDIFSTAFLTLGMVGLFGITDSRRYKNGYCVLAGVGIGLSILSKGPVPVATVCVPFGLYMLLFHRRAGVWIRLAVAAVISAVVFVPWLLAIGHYYAAYDPWGVWYREILQNSTATSNNPAQTAADLKKPLWYYLGFFGWVVPHTPVFIAGLALPFLSRRTRSENAEPTPHEQRGRWAFWLIVVVGLLLLTCLAEKKPRYAMPLFPFAGLLCAAVWQDFARMRSEQKLDAGAAIMLTAQALFFIVPAFGGLLALLVPAIPQRLGEVGRGAYQVLHSLPTPMVGVMLLATLGAGVVLFRMLYRRRFGEALAPLAISSWLLIFTVQALYRADPGNRTNPARRPVEQAMAAAEGAPVYAVAGRRPWLGTLYYANQPLPQKEMPELVQLANASPQSPFFLTLLLQSRGSELSPDDLLRPFEAATHRAAVMITTWSDDGKRTAFYAYGPAAATTTTAPVRP